MFWRRKVRSFEVLGERFALPTLDLKGRLDRASRLRQRLGASWFELLSDPLLKPLRRPERRVRLGFIRAHRVLSAHEAIVFAALDHVAIYDDALVRATEHVAQRSRQKVEELLGKAAERRRVAEKAAHLASRVEDQLDADLRLIAERVRLVGKAAHLMLTRLGRYRAFVRETSRALTERERQLTAQRTLLVHDEHTFELSRELAEDRDIARWHTDPDALCAGIEESLRGMLVDLDGLEGGVAAVPEAVEQLLAKAEAAPMADGGMDPLALEIASLPQVGEVPSRLDDGDWDAVQQHELETELVFSARTVEALGVEVVDWLDAQGTGRGRSRGCAVCGQPIIGGAALGRAHVLCVRCRDQAMAGGHAWLERHGFAPAREHGSRRYESGVTRLIFEAVLGWVPSVGPAREPVTGVTWYEAIEFCNALSRREGRRPAYRVRGDKVTLRAGPSGGGWRLVEGAVPARGALREWRWGRIDGGAARSLVHGLRPIAQAGRGAVDRAVPEVREDDLTFRITCEVEPAVEEARVSEQRSAERPRPKAGRSASPITPRAADPATGRRVVQALSLGMLVSGAAVMLAVEEASVSGGSRPVVAEPGAEAVSSTTSGSIVETPPPAPSPAEPAEPEPAGDEAKAAASRPVDVLLEEGYAARAKKDRKAARTAFDRAVVVAPEDLEARYESAREAAYARDANQAFLHLEVVRQAAESEPKAHRLLMQALSEPDFARLKRDKRWKTIEAATR